MAHCTICDHNNRAEIELGLANRVPVRVLATRYEISKDAAYRHRNNHMPDALLQKLRTTGKDQPVDLEQLRITESEGLLQHLVAQRGKLYQLLDMAEELQHVGDACKVHARLSENLKTTGQLLGDLRSGGTVINNQVLMTSPEYHRVRTAIMQALRPHREALRAVGEALRCLEAQELPAIEHQPEVVSQ
ncbi:hypothetical protein [Microbulbifer sp.]|uniref:hypothetical protein n=1 Tax=Microbulbifer sp. TaxID=1908541 RepID=UPI00258CAAF1|nr:hypothetical protein [Microbulbifer sp.]